MRFVCLCALALVLTSCDSADAPVPTLGFVNEPPETIVAGTPFELTLRGTPYEPYTDVKVVVLRGRIPFSDMTAVPNDTLVAVPLDIPENGVPYDQTVSVTVPAERITEAQVGTLGLATRFESGQGFVGGEVQIVPAR